MSHPAGVRGLKLVNRLANIVGLRSHPAGVRGLKHDQAHEPPGGGLSHPAGVRGLKPKFHVLTGLRAYVAPRRGAWIETSVKNPSDGEPTCRTPQGCVD